METGVIQLLGNPWRGSGLPFPGLPERNALYRDPAEPLALLAYCPSAAPTPLRSLPGLAGAFGIGGLLVKDERARMNLGSFKALGAAFVIAREAALRAGGPERLSDSDIRRNALRGALYVCASAGNHGLSVAAAARVFGASAEIVLSETVPEAFAGRLRALGAQVTRAGSDYEASMRAAIDIAANRGGTLLSDSSWSGYTELPARVMQGYLAMGAEIVDALAEPPTHVFLQAGVGGLAAAMTIMVRDRWGAGPRVIIVEPESAPALMESVRAGCAVRAPGPVSNMGRLDCKEPSLLALVELGHDADLFVTVSDAEAARTVELLAEQGIGTTPSGAAGLCALQHAGDLREAMELGATSRALAIISEGSEQG